MVSKPSNLGAYVNKLKPNLCFTRTSINGFSPSEALDTERGRRWTESNHGKQSWNLFRAECVTAAGSPAEPGRKKNKLISLFSPSQVILIIPIWTVWSEIYKHFCCICVIYVLQEWCILKNRNQTCYCDIFSKNLSVLCFLWCKL